MGHKDDSGKTFGPGHNGWYCIVPYNHPTEPRSFELPVPTIYKKAKSAMEAVQLAGHSFSTAAVRAVTKEHYADLIAKLERGETP